MYKLTQYNYISGEFRANRKLDTLIQYNYIFIMVAATAVVLFGCATTNCPAISSAEQPGNSNTSAQSVLDEQQMNRRLESWQDNSSVKQRIVAFLQDVTVEGRDRFVPIDDRFAVFDNDGTLWSEQPSYFQLLFAMDRVRALAPEHPEWQHQAPFNGAIEGDLEKVAASGHEGLFQLIDATHTGMTTDAFVDEVKQWMRDARHPTKNVRYTELVYQPMLELIALLHACDFKVYIVSGGGTTFMRAWAPEVYGIPGERIIGSLGNARFEMRGDTAVIVKEPGIAFVDDKEGKPIAIDRSIGKRPIFAFGNSDGDLQMLQYTASSDQPNLVGLVHHTDNTREWAYDRQSSIGRLDKALDEATARDWVVVDMQEHWKAIYPLDKQ